MIPLDKQLHFAGNVGLFVVGAMFADYRDHDVAKQLLAGLGLAMSVSIAKELIHDLIMKRGHSSWGDMAANALGQAVGAVIVVMAWLPTS